MSKLTKSEWFLFLFNMMLALVILISVIWALLPQSNNCWNNNLNETTNIQKCEEH